MRSNGKLLIVHFDRSNLVQSYNTILDSSKKTVKRTVKKPVKKAAKPKKNEWDLLSE